MSSDPDPVNQRGRRIEDVGDLPSSQGALGERALYLPTPASIQSLQNLTATERLFRLRRDDGRPLGHQPGQFVEVSVLGVGEAPISVCSAEGPDDPSFELCVRAIGSVTQALHALGPGSTVGIRGPLGHGFELESLAGQDVLFVAGGLGLPPLRSLIQHCLAHRDDFGRLTLLYGAKCAAELLFLDDLEEWGQASEFDVQVTVDVGEEGWSGHVGLITTLIPPLELEPWRTRVVVVGPPVMYRFVIKELNAKGLTDEHIWVSFERKMRCGVRKCGHCTIGDYYCCTDGPVFNYALIRDLSEALR